MMIPRPPVSNLQLDAVRDIWPAILSAGVPADRWLRNYLHRHRSKFASQDRRFISEMVYSLLRHKIYFDFLTGHFGLDRESGAAIWMAALHEGVLGEGDFSKKILDLGLPRENTEKIARVILRHELPPDLKIYGEEKRLEIQYSFPDWWIARWVGRWGGRHCENILRGLRDRPDLVIRINPLKTSREDFIKRLERCGRQAEATKISPYGILLPRRFNIEDTEEFRDGFFEIQDEGSQILCQKMQPRPGQVVWDVCAGSGGKTLALAALMKGQGTFVATDIRPRSLENLKKRARRAGICRAVVTAPVSEIQKITEIKKGADIILVDAPCSGTGTVRRNPDAKWRLKESDLAVFGRRQADILEKALPFLGKEGRIYYSTCSFEPEENEAVFDEFLARHPELKGVRLSDSGDGFLRLDPYSHGTDGFFMAAATRG